MHACARLNLPTSAVACVCKAKSHNLRWSVQRNTITVRRNAYLLPHQHTSGGGVLRHAAAKPFCCMRTLTVNVFRQHLHENMAFYITELCAAIHMDETHSWWHFFIHMCIDCG